MKRGWARLLLSLSIMLFGCRVNSSEPSNIPEAGSTTAVELKPEPPSVEATVVLSTQLPGSSAIAAEQAFHLAADGEHIWVSSRSTGELMRLEAAGHKVIEREVLGEPPWMILEMRKAIGSVFLSDFGSGRLLVADANTLQVAWEVDVRIQSGLAVEEAGVWVACCGADSSKGVENVSLIRFGDHQVVKALAIEAPHSLAILSGKLWVSSVIPGKVTQVNGQTGSAPREILLPGLGGLIAAGDKHVIWVDVLEMGVAHVNAESMSLEVIPLVNDPVGRVVTALIALSDDQALAALSDGTVVFIDRESESTQIVFNVGANPRMALVGNTLWVVDVTGELVQLRLHVQSNSGLSRHP